MASPMLRLLPLVFPLRSSYERYYRSTTKTRSHCIRRYMIVSVPKEMAPGERRVALVPELVSKLITAGMDVVVESGAGLQAGFLDSAYVEKGARLEPAVFDKADILLKVL